MTERSTIANFMRGFGHCRSHRHLDRAAVDAGERKLNRMFSLSDVELDRVMDAAALLPAQHRDVFIRSVAGRVSGIPNFGLAEIEIRNRFYIGRLRSLTRQQGLTYEHQKGKNQWSLDIQDDDDAFDKRSSARTAARCGCHPCSGMLRAPARNGADNWPVTSARRNGFPGRLRHGLMANWSAISVRRATAATNH